MKEEHPKTLHSSHLGFKGQEADQSRRRAGSERDQREDCSEKDLFYTTCCTTRLRFVEFRGTQRLLRLRAASLKL